MTKKSQMRTLQAGNVGLTNGCSSLSRPQRNRMGMINGSGRTNGLINGCGRVNGMVNGRGRTNGLVNGMGRVNGMVNGNGRTNGLINGCGRINGMINGNGRINGNKGVWGRVNGLVNGGGVKNGYVNGFREKGTENYDIIHVPNSVYFKTKDRRRRTIEVASVLVVFGILAVIPFASVYTIHTIEKIQIDGIFDDWNKAGVNFLDTSRYFEGSSQNKHIQIEQYASVYENQKVSFYIRAKDVIMESNTCYMNQINIFIDTDNSKFTGYRIRGIGADFRVVVNGINDGVVDSTGQYFSGGKDQRSWSWVTGREISCAVKGDQMELTVPKYILNKNENYEVIIATIDGYRNMAITDAFDTRGFSKGGYSTYGNFTGDTDPNSKIKIDGIFSDWKDYSGMSYEKDKRIGIVEEKNLIEEKTSSFYIKTEGEMFIGYIPTPIEEKENKTNETTEPSKGNATEMPSHEIPAPPKELPEGNDTMIIQIENDYRIFLKGIYNEIYISQLENTKDGGNSWEKVNDVASGYNGSEFECQLTNFDYPYMKISVTTYDWIGDYDFVEADAVTLSIGKGGGAQTFGSIGDDNQIQVVIDATTNPDATARSHQRNCFRDPNDYYWAFFNDVSATKMERSDDTTATAWTGSQTSVGNGDLCHSLWYDDSWTVWLAYCNLYDIRLKKGTLSGNPTTISVGSEDTVLDGSSGTPYLIGWVTLDSSGYIWVEGRYYDGTNYKVHVVRSQNVGDASSWNSVSTISPNSASTETFGIILPLASQDMYAIYKQNTDLKGVRYTNSNTTWWTGKDSLATLTGTIGRDFSAVVDSSYNIHMVYVDSSGKLQYKKRAGTTWGSTTEIDSNTDIYYPSVSINTVSQSLGVFYARSTTIYYSYKEKVLTTWTSPESLVTGVTNLKWVDSAYHGDGADGDTIVIYMSESSSPYNANSLTKKIPDMPEIIRMALPPVVILIAVSVSIYRKRK